ncbi:hypothetical protein [Tateyamaria sp. SN6-1]|uniref:hypothetical protein n=1 Tax=Tateyamaria sp. SN6-1 TaxID=3092148 RepID=UPI0039F5E639
MANDGDPIPVGVDDLGAGHASGECSYAELIRNHFYEYVALLEFLKDISGQNGRAAQRAAIQIVTETGPLGVLLNGYESFAMGIAAMGARGTSYQSRYERASEQAYEDARAALLDMRDAFIAWKNKIEDHLENCGVLYASAAVFIDLGGIELALVGMSAAAIRIIRMFVWRVRLIGPPNAPTAVQVSASSRRVDLQRTYPINRLREEYGDSRTSGTTDPDPDAQSQPEAPRPLSAREQRLESFRARLMAGDEDFAASNAGLEASFARQRVKRAFADEFGVSYDNLDGISGLHPITIELFPPPNQIAQWRNPTRADVGEFFDPSNGQTSPSQLGISSFGRQLEHYNVTGDGVALQGIGKPNYRDRYTVRNRVVPTEGGRPQWVIGEEFRPTTADIDRVSLTWREHPENRNWVENDDGSFTSDEGTIRPVQVPDRNDPSRTLTFWEMDE